jgi:hypothetical protein
MKLVKLSFLSSALCLGLRISGCSTAPAARPSGPQGPPGPQGASDHDRDRDRDRNADQDQQDRKRQDRAVPCAAGEHRDSVGGCIRD